MCDPCDSLRSRRDLPRIGSLRGLVGIWLLVAGCDSVFSLDRAFDAPTPDAPPGDAIDGPIDAAIDALIDAPIDAPMIDAPASCPTDYTYAYSSHLYRFVSTGPKLTWQAAAADCANDEYGHPSFRTHLVVLNNDPERGQIGNASASTAMWIGLSDLLTEGFFRNVTTENTPGYPPMVGGPWGIGEPGGDGDCVVKTASSADLQDRDCAVPEYYVCECDGFANTPAQYTP